jgi:hypothetical protein
MKRQSVTVLKDISPAIKKGDILVKRAGYYTKEGEEKKTPIFKKTFSWWRFKKAQHFACPNHYLVTLVENQPDYFKQNV